MKKALNRYEIAELLMADSGNAGWTREEKSAKRYVVTHYKNGKPIENKFATLEQAKLCASRIFIATGIFVGIHESERGEA